MVAARSAAMGFNRLVDASLRRAQPAHRVARDSARRDVASRSGASSSPCRPRCSSARRGGWARICFAALAARTGHRLLVLAREARHELHAAVPRAGDGGRAGRRMARRRRAGRRRAVAARAGDRHLGRRASTCCMPVRISSSIARTACDSIPVRFGVARVAASSRASMHVVTVGCLAALGVVAELGWVYMAGVAGVALLLVFEQSLVTRARSLAGQARVRPERLCRDPVSRDHRGGDLCALSQHAGACAHRWRSPAPAARSTRCGRWRRCSSEGATWS